MPTVLLYPITKITQHLKYRKKNRTPYSIQCTYLYTCMFVYSECYLLFNVQNIKGKLWFCVFEIKIFLLYNLYKYFYTQTYTHQYVCNVHKQKYKQTMLHICMYIHTCIIIKISRNHLSDHGFMFINLINTNITTNVYKAMKSYLNVVILSSIQIQTHTNNTHPRTHCHCYIIMLLMMLMIVSLENV